MSDKRRSLFAAEVNTLNHEVRSQQEIFARATRPIDRTVIANTEHKLSVHSGYAMAQVLDPLEFSHAIQFGLSVGAAAGKPRSHRTSRRG